MSVQNLANNIIQQQNIVLNQVPLTHTLMNVNATNGIPVVNAISHTNSTDQGPTMVDTIGSKSLFFLRLIYGGSIYTSLYSLEIKNS